MEIMLPDFDQYKPTKLTKLCENIEAGYYEFVEYKVDIKSAIRKLKNNIRINESEMVALIGEHQVMIHEKVIDQYYTQVKHNLEKISIRKRRTILKRLLDQFQHYYFYTGVFNGASKLFALFHEDVVVSQISLPMESSWYKTRERYISKINSNNISTYMDKTTPMIIEMIVRLFELKKVKEPMVKHMLALLDDVPVNVIGLIIEAYISSIYHADVQALKDGYLQFFTEIKRIAGTPETKHMIWLKVSEKSVTYYRKWLMLDRMFEHFEKLEVNRMDRLEFWKGYFHEFIDLEFFKSYGQCLIIETQNHTFVEFNGAAGGKLYIYDRDFMNIEKVRNMQRRYTSNARVTRLLKDSDHARKELVHTYGSWQSKFKRELMTYEYYSR